MRFDQNYPNTDSKFHTMYYVFKIFIVNDTQPTIFNSFPKPKNDTEILISVTGNRFSEETLFLVRVTLSDLPQCNTRQLIIFRQQWELFWVEKSSTFLSVIICNFGLK